MIPAAMPLPAPVLPRVLRALALAGLLAAALLAQAANWRVVFPGGPAGRAAFVDGDCYARMTRARSVFAHPGTVVREHGFENFPAGVRPHTTAPLDYGLAALAGALRSLRPGDGADLALDRAGALVSPLLGAFTLGFLGWWTGREQLPGQWPALGLAATSPILAHGFALGRPDHQSLQLACLAVALAAETVLWQRSSRPWALAGGLAWGLALWVSLYEPAVLLAGTLVAAAACHREALRRRARWTQLAVFLAVFGAATLVEGGWHLELPGHAGGGPGADAGRLFTAWSRQVGELGSAAPWSGLILRWVGLGIFAAPVLLWLAWRRGERNAALWLGLFVGVWSLTCWQTRWGYLLALVAAMSLPTQARALPAGRARWLLPLAGAAFLLGMIPVLGEFASRVDRAWHPHPEDRERAAEALAIMETADFLRADAAADPTAPAGGILAPWWLSPALAYRSGQPAVAGSSHESLPGTADAARFFLLPARDPRAFTLLHARRVRWVVTDDPERTLPLAADLLGATAAIPPDALGHVLARFPRRAPRGLTLVREDPFFHVYAVNPLVYAPDP